MMTVVLDTNILVRILSSKSDYHFVFQDFLSGKYQIAVSTDILLEYEEIIGQKYGIQTATFLLGALNVLPNVAFITPFYQWNLITNDPDDNKFADCAILANANCLVTADKHFNHLKKLPFPPVNVISLEDFALILDRI
jgi:uncharacterized protein